jgi:hypothetical protein
MLFILVVFIWTCEENSAIRKNVVKIQGLLKLRTNDNTTLLYHGNCNCTIKSTITVEEIDEVQWDFNLKNVFKIYFDKYGSLDIYVSPSKKVTILEYSSTIEKKERQQLEEELEKDSFIPIGNVNTISLNKKIAENLKNVALACGARLKY